MDKIPCFLCGKKLSVRTDKNGKLYLICDPCGSQHFIRRKQGMERLAELGHYFYQEKAGLAERMEALLRVRALAGSAALRRGMHQRDVAPRWANVRCTPVPRSRTWRRP